MEKRGEQNGVGGGIVDERGSNVYNLVYVLVGQHIPWKAPPKHQLPVRQQTSVIRQSIVVLAGNSSMSCVISIPKTSLGLRSLESRQAGLQWQK
jgi:hypothetical protein